MAVAKKRGRKKLKVETLRPDFSKITPENKDHMRALYSALHYAQYEMNDKALKKEAVQYAKDQKLAYQNLNALGDKDFSVLGKYAYLLNGGAVLPEGHEVGFQRLLDRKMQEGKEAKAQRRADVKAQEKKKTGPVLTVQDRMREQAAEVAQIFDGWVDTLVTDAKAKVTKDMNPLEKMQAAELKAGQARWMKKFYRNEVKEMKQVVAGKDADLKEGYSNLKKTQASRILKLLESIVQAADMIITMTKAKRKPRKKKVVSQDKIVAKLKFKVSDAEYGIASVNPVTILGAKEVWVFNTKTRKLGRYVAKDESGLSVKSASIIDFNEVTSTAKNLRNPKEQIAEMMGAGKVQLRKFLDNIKAVDIKLTGRLNEHVVILRVVK